MEIVYNGKPATVTIKETMSKIIPQICEKDPKAFYLDADLMSCLGMINWSREHPQQSVDCGVAEANMVGIAVGLAAEGFRPIVHSFGPFISRRAFDQMFISAAYAHYSLTVLGSDPGVTAEFNGGTHMPFEDVALYSVIPGSTVIDVCDHVMMKKILPQCIDMPGIKYIRFGRKAYPQIYSEDTEFEIGKAKVLREGTEVTLLVTGFMTADALEAAKTLEEKGISAAVVNLFTIKPIDREAIVHFARRTGAVITVENHNYIGGLYSIVASVLAKECPVKMDYVAVDDHFGDVGPIGYLKTKFGLTKDSIVEKTLALLNR